jgi:DNA-binding NarL/FixJ family response regulator
MRICVVDDHDVVQQGLQASLPAEPGMEVVGVAGSGADALHQARRLLPDLIITEFRLPDMPADDFCRAVATRFPGTTVVIFTAYLGEDMVRRAVSAGAAAFVTKAAGLDELRRVLRELAAGNGKPLHGGSAAIVKRLFECAAPREDSRKITPRQERVLDLAAQGLTYCEIASLLHLSESTVRFHIQGLKARLGVRTRTELVAFAIRSGLITPEPHAAVA